MAYQNLVGQFIYKQPLLRTKFDQLGENDSYLKDNNWQDGVKVVFYQATVPTGWTQDVSANDKWLRVVNNTGGNPGGATGGSLAVSSGLTLAHAHASPTAAPNHTHLMASHQHRMSQNDPGTGGSALGAPRGIGNTVVSQFTGANSATTGLAWTRFFDSAVLDQSASSSAGSHTHSVPSQLTNVTPHYADVIIGVKSSSSGYTDLTNQFNHNDRIRYEPFGATGGLYGNDVYSNARLTPAGTVSVFFQSAAPVGWTKLLTQNNRGLRVVSGAGGGVGGTAAFSNTIVLSHSHTFGAAGDHTHTMSTHRHNVAGADPGTTLNSSQFFFLAIDGSGYLRPTNNDGTSQTAAKGRTSLGGGGVSGGPGNHAHTTSTNLSNVSLAYVDVIQCQKLSTGAPYAFADLTSTVQYKKLVSYQRLDKFAKNDEYQKYHLVPAGSVMSFYQSAIPFLWNLLGAQHDKVLRVVSGAGGGSGGSHLISNTITLQHTHTIPTQSHGHFVNHTHTFDSQVQAAGSYSGVSYLMQNSSLSSNGFVAHGNIGTGTGRAIKTTSEANNALTDNVDHNHGGVTDSQLTNVTFAYANVILCQKA